MNRKGSGRKPNSSARGSEENHEEPQLGVANWKQNTSYSSVYVVTYGGGDSVPLRSFCSPRRPKSLGGHLFKSPNFPLKKILC
jgi:hypothetical protein